MFAIQAIRILCNIEKNQASFARKTGIDTSTLNYILKKGDTSKEKGVSLKTIMSVINAYENLNVRWFMTGEGEMWIEDLRPKGTFMLNEPEATYTSLNVDNLQELLKLTKQRVTVLENALRRENEEVAREYGIE